MRVTGAGRVRNGSRLWESEPSSPPELCLCQLNVRLGEAETDSEPGSSGAERGERRLHGWELTANRIKLSTLIIESNYSHDVRCCRLHTLISGSTSSSQSVYFAGKVLTLKDQSPQSPQIITWWWWQVLLVSPPPQADNDSMTATGSDMVYTKPFAPWKPGDAYSVESDLSDWRLLLGSVQDGSQARWDRREIFAFNLQSCPIEIYPENSESVRMFPRMCQFRQNASR